MKRKVDWFDFWSGYVMAFVTLGWVVQIMEWFK